MRIFFLLLVLLASCSPHSLEDYQFEGEALCRKMVYELQKVHTREELVIALPKLKKHFEALVELMIEAKNFQRKRPGEEDIDPAFFEHPYADALQDELERVCKLEGGREMIEKAQRESLIRLDRFTKKKAKKS